MSPVWLVMVTAYDTSDFTRERGERIIGGLAAFRYFFTVFLWTPVSRVMPLMDRPLRLAS